MLTKANGKERENVDMKSLEKKERKFYLRERTTRYTK